MRLWRGPQTPQPQPAISAMERDAVAIIGWVDRIIGATVVEAGLHAVCERVAMGPHTLTYYLRLVQGKPSVMAALAPALRANLLAQPGSPPLAGDIRVTPDPAVGWRIEVPSPFPVTPSPAQLARATRGLRVAVALDQQFQPVVVDLADAPALMWIGPTGRGKTEAARSALFALVTRNSPADLALVLCAEKRGRWADFAATPHCLAAAHTAVDIDRLLANLTRKMDERLRDGARRPAILVIVDDAHNLFDGERGKSIARSLARLSTTGREAGVYSWLLTQDAGSKSASGSQMYEANARVKVMFRATNRQAGARAAGMGGAGVEALSGHPGDCLVDLDGERVRAATAYDPDLSRKLPRLETPAASTPPTPPTPVSAPVFDPPATPQNPSARGDDPTPVSTLVFDWPINAARPLSEEEAQEARRLRDNGLSLNKLCERVYGPKNNSKMEHLREALGLPHPRLKIVGGDE